jgi:hypothetical protein
MRADFTQYLGPQPGDPPPYVQPEGAAPLQQPDPATVCHIRLELARQEQARYEEQQS